MPRDRRVRTVGGVQATAPQSPATRTSAQGLGLTLASAGVMSWLGLTTQLAYDAGAGVGTLLSGRFVVAAAILWPLVLVIRSPHPTRRQAAAGLLLGAGYSAHAWLFSSSLARLDAGLVDLLLFTYPALVMIGAMLVGRERLSPSRAFALACATAGMSLVLVGGLGSIDPVGAALALGSALAYAAYILLSAGELERTDPFVLTALVTTGAAIVLTVAGAAGGNLSLDVGGEALALVALVGVVAVGGMTTFVAGIRRLGPSRASIVSAVQPALTPVLGFAVFADRLGPTQLAGGVLVISGVVIMEARSRPSEASARPTLRRWLRHGLARAGVTMTVSPGGRIVREGDPADAFYVIERGRAVVLRDDRELASLGRGEFFGEIALLGGGLRTASVVATTPMRLRVVPRGELVRAMAARRRLANLVQRVRVERLAATQLSPGPA